LYLLSMLKDVFYGSSADLMCDVIPSCDLDDLDLKNQGNQQVACFGTSCELPTEATFEDASPRELFIAASFLALIMTIGFYPKVATSLYDAKTVAVNAQVREIHHQVAMSRSQSEILSFSSMKPESTDTGLAI
ncbi:MAG: NAD(P)H-quinone oxidoreductase subunit 4, partial [Cyanobacteria bacterium P01_E01_bin.6]